MKEISKILNWLENEKVKDNLELKTSKQNFIDEIKKIKKEDMFLVEKDKKTFWKKLKKIIWGT